MPKAEADQMTTNQVMSISDYVNYYHSLGWLIFPVSPGLKYPSIHGRDIKWGQHLDGSWNEFPEDHGLCVVTGKASGGLVVIDWDQEKFYYDYFGDAEKEHRKSTRVDKTGKGIHSFFYSNKPVKTQRYIVPGSKNKIEILAERAICVLTPTIHPDTGKPYEMISTTTEIARVDDLNETINAILSTFGIEPGGNNSPSGFTMEQVNAGGLREGEGRNTAGFIKASSLLNPLERKLPVGPAWAEFCKWNETHEPPLDLKELQVIFNSSLKNRKVSQDFAKLDKLSLQSFAELIMQKYTFKTMADNHKEIRYYHDGCYVLNGETVISIECEKLVPECSKYKVSEITGIIQRRTFTDREKFNRDFSKVSINDRILNLDTFKLEPHDPKFLTTFKLPVNYIQGFKCPLQFVSFLKDCLEPHDIITVIEEIANVLMLGRTNHEIAGMWIGSGANGKSSMIKIITGIFGKENCSHVSLHSMQDDRFALVETYGKIVNLYGDISNRELDNLGLFKQLVSGETLRVQRKHQQPFNMEPFVKNFFSANEMPKIKDDSDAIFRRMPVTKWNNQFIPGVNLIEDIDKKILKAERDQIFSMIIENFKTLQRNGGFRYKQTIAQVRETIQRESDKTREFIEECFVKEPNALILKDKLFEIYQKYNGDKQYEIFLKQRLGARLPTYGFIGIQKKVKGKNDRYWKGFRINKESDWIKNNVRGLDDWF